MNFLQPIIKPLAEAAGQAVKTGAKAVGEHVMKHGGEYLKGILVVVTTAVVSKVHGDKKYEKGKKDGTSEQAQRDSKKFAD